MYKTDNESDSRTFAKANRTPAPAWSPAYCHKSAMQRYSAERHKHRSQSDVTHTAIIAQSRTPYQSHTGLGENSAADTTRGDVCV